MKFKFTVLIVVLSIFTFINGEKILFAADNSRFGLYGFYLGQTYEEAIKHANDEGWRDEGRYETIEINPSGAWFFHKYFNTNDPTNIRDMMSLFDSNVIRKLPKELIKYDLFDTQIHVNDGPIMKLSFQKERNSSNPYTIYKIVADRQPLRTTQLERFRDEFNNTMKNRYGKMNYNEKNNKGWTNGQYYIFVGGNPSFIDKKFYDDYLSYYINVYNKMDAERKSKM